jgi:hypothetical protein
MTDAGRRLLPYARRVSRLLHEAARAASDDETPQGALTIGSLEATAMPRKSPFVISLSTRNVRSWLGDRGNIRHRIAMSSGPRLCSWQARAWPMTSSLLVSTRRAKSSASGGDAFTPNDCPADGSQVASSSGVDSEYGTAVDYKTRRPFSFHGYGASRLSSQYTRAKNPPITRTTATNSIGFLPRFPPSLVHDRPLFRGFEEDANTFVKQATPG